MFILTSILIVTPVYAAEDIVPSVIYNDLTELFARKSYNNQKPVNLIYQNGAVQSETVHFNDTMYGTHIWRVTDSNNAYTLAHNHINRSPWNSNGSKLGLISNRYFPPYWSSAVGQPADSHIYLLDTNGDNFTNIDCSACPDCNDNGSRFRHFVWDRNTPEFTYFSADDGLYRLNVNNPGIYTKVAALPDDDKSKVIYSYPSEQNIIMVIDDFNNNYDSPHFYFIDLNKTIDDPSQVISYPVSFNLNWPGHDPDTETSMHDIYFTRKNDGSYTFNYGPVAGLGEYLFFKAPIDGDSTNIELWYSSDGSEGIPYHSHPAWGPQGYYTSYFGEQYPYGSNKWGWHVANDENKEHIKQLSTISGGHIAWDGYDSDLLCAAVKIDGGRKLIKATISGAENNAVAFVNPYTGLNDDTDGYHTIPRPAQSPDSTKLFYHSSMTESSDAFVDGYIAVIRYPFSAQNLRIANTSVPTISWDAPVLHRETRGYHVYRAVGNSNKFVEITSSAINSFDYTDTSIEEGSDYYYAVTSEEWSGIESNELSDIIRVTYSDGKYLYSTVENQGRMNFDNNAPSVVENISWAFESAGIYTIHWDHSTEKDLAYYNIYYSVEGIPNACPQRIIASVPKSQKSYIDWQARTDTEGYYLVTAVDRQGNESSTGSNSDVLYDLNNDLIVDIQDVTLCIDIILGISSGDADVTEDGLTNFLDVISIVNETL